MKGETEMLLNGKEDMYITAFMNNLKNYAKEGMTLKWDNDNYISATFDVYFEDENEIDEDNDGYEEYISFSFKAVEIVGNPPIELTEDNYFLINYHNFPSEILVNGVKIN